ncbi:MAG: 16S rRNA (cytosine(967)-C(5))-methyltransferase RsmB [Candidatus Humimicrobiaceae bacterium]
MTKSRPESKNPREIIFFILNDYFKEFCNLKDLINCYLKNSKLSDLNKNFVYNISKGLIRNYLGIDYFLSFFSKISLSKLDPEVLNILRIGIFQAIFLNRVPDYSIVNECVEIAKKYTRPGSQGFINAVLRKITSLENAKRTYVENIKLIKDPAAKISIYYSFPEWIVKYWIGQYGIEKTLKICRSLNNNPDIYFIINTIKTKKEYIFDKLKDEGFIEIDKYFGSESFRINKGSQELIKTDLLSTGAVYIQDLSSQIAVRYFLEPKENERILDVCSAPGGKALNSSILMKNTGKIIAVDNNPERIALIKENVKKMDMGNIGIVFADAAMKSFLKSAYSDDEKIQSNGQEGSDLKFDKIFIDAPCSAFGTASKNPDAKYNKNKKDIENLKKNSLKILENCDEYLKIGGRIVFYTCTLSSIENFEVIDNFLTLYKNKYKADIMDTKKIFAEISPEYRNESSLETEVCFEIMPYYFKSEGATVCSLIKIS